MNDIIGFANEDGSHNGDWVGVVPSLCLRGHDTSVVGRDGTGRCRSCLNLYQRIYRKMNAAKLTAAKRRYYEANRERVQAQSAAYRAAYPEKKRANRLRAYGLTPEVYDAMLAQQNGLCAVCLKPEIRSNRRGGVPCPLSVDHDHATGRVRGLLCNQCNLALGATRDDPRLLRLLATYLEEGGGK